MSPRSWETRQFCFVFIQRTLLGLFLFLGTAGLHLFLGQQGAAALGLESALGQCTCPRGALQCLTTRRAPRAARQARGR